MAASEKGRIHPWVAKAEHTFVTVYEGVGIDSFWVPDHPVSCPDSWTTLSALAVTTRRIRLGPLVSCVYYRNPVELARLAADVDRPSNGRFVLGLGISDAAAEFAALGLPFLPVSVRQRGLDEGIRVPT